MVRSQQALPGVPVQPCIRSVLVCLLSSCFFFPPSSGRPPACKICAWYNVYLSIILYCPTPGHIYRKIHFFLLQLFAKFFHSFHHGGVFTTNQLFCFSPFFVLATLWTYSFFQSSSTSLCPINPGSLWPRIDTLTLHS